MKITIEVETGLESPAMAIRELVDMLNECTDPQLNSCGLASNNHRFRMSGENVDFIIDKER